MKKNYIQSKIVFAVLITILLFNSCGHYKHKIFTSDRDDLVLKVKVYNLDHAHGNSKVKEYYVLHFKDSMYNITNVHFDPETIDLRKSDEKENVKNMVLLADIVPDNEIDSLMQFKDTIYKYMLTNPKGKLEPKQEMKHFMYQTHLFLKSMDVTENKIRIGIMDINEVHFFYENRSVKRHLGIALPIVLVGGGVLAFLISGIGS